MQFSNHNKSTRKSSFQRLIGWILCSLLVGACGKLTPVVYSEFINVHEKGLAQNWVYTFNPVPFDSTEIANGKFDVILLVRYANSCGAKSVIFDVESFSIAQTQPDSTRVEIPLFYNDGVPYGKGNLGVFETTYTLATDMKLPESYEISLVTPLSPQETKGIIDIGIKLVRSGQKEFDLPDLLHLKETIFSKSQTHQSSLPS